MQKDEREKGKLSFIQEARREQIIQAAIETLGGDWICESQLVQDRQKSWHFHRSDFLSFSG